MYLRKVHEIDNTPSDWNAHWHTCSRCGRRYHGSDGRCPCEEYEEELEPVESEENGEDDGE